MWFPILVRWHLHTNSACVRNKPKSLAWALCPTLPYGSQNRSHFPGERYISSHDNHFSPLVYFSLLKWNWFTEAQLLSNQLTCLQRLFPGCYVWLCMIDWKKISRHKIVRHLTWKCLGKIWNNIFVKIIYKQAAAFTTDATVNQLASRLHFLFTHILKNM